MRLRDLEPELLRIESKTVRRYVDSLADAQGVLFLCPKCYVANGGAVGTHSVMCWFDGREVPDDEVPGPGRWTPQGTGLDDLTLQGRYVAAGQYGARSVQLNGGCCAHFHITNGEVTDA